MSVFSVQDGSIQTAMKEVDNIQISVTKGRKFILNQGAGASLTMKQMVAAVKQFSKNGEDVSELKRKITVLELQGKAKLANESLLTRIGAFFRQLFSNLSFNTNFHLNKLDAIDSHPLTDEQKKLATDFVDALNELKSSEKDIYNAMNSSSELMFIGKLLESLPKDPNTALGKKREALKNKITSQVEKLGTKFENSKTDNIESKLKSCQKPLNDLTLNEQIAIMQHIGKTHPLLVYLIIESLNSKMKQLEVASQIKSLRSLELKALKMVEHY